MILSERAKALLDSKAFGMVGLVSQDGSAQVVPVWVMRDGETPVFNTVEGHSKMKNLRRDPRATLTIVDLENAYSYAELRGRVEFEEGEAANDTIDALAKKYIDQDKYPWGQPGQVRVNCRMLVERELGG